MNVKNNLETGLIQDPLILVLGMCPLLTVADSLQKGLWIGLACMTVIFCSNLLVAAIRNLIPHELRLVSILIINAGVVSVLNLLVQAWAYDMAMKLGIYVPLIAMNCLVLAFIENYSIQLNITDSITRSIRLGLLVLGILILAGTLREYSGIYLLRQPFGALLLLALALAVINRFGSNTKAGPQPDLP